MEMLIVIGIIAMLVWLALFLDLSAYRGDAFRAERNALVIALQKARADSLNNINQAPHGVAVYPGGYEGYVAFQGVDYATRDVSYDQKFPASYSVLFDAGSLEEIIFEQLSGASATEGSVFMRDPERGMTAVITINHEGAIRW